MPSEPTLDFDALLAPISEESPSGAFLRRSDFERFQQAKDARAEAVNSERKIREFAMYDEDELAQLNDQGQGIEAPTSPDWRSVLDQCVDIIANHSKDLWVASWLIEANVRRNGFAGARDGFKLITKLCETYWDNIYPPRDDEDGYLDTVSQLTSLNGLEGPGTLIEPLEEAELVPDFGALTFAAYREATERGDAEISEGDFDNAVRQVPLDDLRRREEDLVETLEAFSEMTRVLSEKCRPEGDEEDYTPPSSQIQRTLESIKKVYATLTRDRLGGDAGEDEGGEGAPTGLTQNAASAVDIAQAQVNNREDAFRMLMKVSEFFRKTEPHSPVSYMLQQAVEFGRMDLPAMLEKLIRDEDVLKNFYERVGIPVKEDSYDDD